MRIEKINDNQIRCTLSSADLEDRHIKLSELAYGTDKAKDLFRDMMAEADERFGFTADNIPLMIEAIPLSPDCIIFNITKIEDPEELDTRFSKFSQSDLENIESLDDDPRLAGPGADEILTLFDQIKQEINTKLAQVSGSGPAAVVPGPPPSLPTPDLVMSFRFDSIDTFLDAASVVSSAFDGSNVLYQEPDTHYYILTLSCLRTEPAEFNRICNILSQYGTRLPAHASGDKFFKEHYRHVIDQPIQTFAKEAATT